MRGIFSVLHLKSAGSLFLKPQYGNGISNLAFKKFELKSNTVAAAFTSFVPHNTYNNTSPSYFEKYFNLFGSKSSEQARSLTKFSWKSGKRKTVRAVTHRFFRLHWGIWIRTIAGRFKKLWKKNRRQKNMYKQHVFCNATQSRMLDTMVKKSWRKPKYYIDDPYEVYHNRENFRITRTKPWRPDGVDYE